MECSIKRNLPTPPRPATKPSKDPRYFSFGSTTKLITESPELAPTTPTKRARAMASIKRAHELQHAKAAEKWAVVRKMAVNGFTDEEIAKVTGYAPSSIPGIIKRLRLQGIPIPDRRDKNGKRNKGTGAAVICD